MPLDTAFDLVWTRDCVLYVPAGEQLSLWDRLGSVLVPNGQLFVTDFCRGEAPLSPEFTRYISDCQYHLSTIDRYAGLLEEAGYRSVHSEDLTDDFLRFLRMELAHLQRDRSSFLQEFTEADYQHLPERWIKKIRFCEHGELCWGLFLARRPG